MKPDKQTRILMAMSLAVDAVRIAVDDDLEALTAFRSAARVTELRIKNYGKPSPSLGDVQKQVARIVDEEIAMSGSVPGQHA